MHSFVLAAVLSIAAARPQLPAGNVNDDRDGDEGDDRDKSCWQKVTLKSRPGLSAAQCPNYPFCGAAAPADFPVPVVNGAPVAPVLNTTPEQTQYWQQAQVKESAILGQKIKPLLRKWNLIKNLRLPRAQPPSQWQLWMGRMLLLATTRYLTNMQKANILASTHICSGKILPKNT